MCAMKECVYLGHVVVGGQVKPLSSKVDAVSSYQLPQMKKQVRTFFLGIDRLLQKIYSKLCRNT